MKRNVFLLALCQALMMSAMSLMITTTPLIGAALATDKQWATVPLAFQFLGMMCATFPISMIMKAKGRRFGFVLGLCIGITGSTLIMLSIMIGNFTLLCAGTFGIGVYSGVGQYYRFAAADVSTEEFRSRAISLVLAGGVTAAFIGPNLANLTRDLFPGHIFAGGYAAVVIIYLLSIGVVYLVGFPPLNEAERGKGGRPLFEIALQPKFLVAVAGATIGYGVMNLVMTSTPLAMKFYQYPFANIAFVIQWHVFAMFVPSFFTGSLIKRFGVEWIMLLGALLLALCVVVNLSGTEVGHFTAALVLLGVGWNFLFIGGTTLVTQCHSPEEKAKTQGLNDLIMFSTVTLTALSSGMLHHVFGWRGVNMGVLPFVVFAVIMLLVAGLRQRSAQPA